MAVHLSRPGHRDGQPAGRSGRHAGQLPADLRDRLERLLRPADGHDDLHHAADDDPPEPAGRPAGRLSRACPRISAATASRACSSRSSSAARPVRDVGAGRARCRAGRLTAAAYAELVQAEQLCEADDLRHRRARPVRRDRRATGRRQRPIAAHRASRPATPPEEPTNVRQAHLGRDPVRPADPADHLARGRSWRSPASPSGSRRKGWWPYLWNEYITSTDHKRIGIMYIVLALVMLVRGFADAIMMRAQQSLAIGAVAGLSPARALQPDLLRARHDHDLLRGDAARDRLHELRRAAAARRARRRLPDA